MHFSKAISYTNESLLEEDDKEQQTEYIQDLLKEVLQTDDIIPALIKLLKELTDLKIINRNNQHDTDQ